MNPKSKKIIISWIKKAEHDLGMAELALKSGEEFTDSICFHCQQFVEKLFKAYLMCLNIDFMKTHSLSYLTDLIADKESVSEDVYRISELLEDYAVVVRYPADRFEPTYEDAKEAYLSAKKIKELYYQKVILFIN